MKHFSGFSGSPSRRQLFGMWERLSILVWNMDCNDMDCCCMTKVSQDASKPGHYHMLEKRRRFGERNKNQGGVGERTKLKAKKNSPIPPHLIYTCSQLGTQPEWTILWYVYDVSPLCTNGPIVTGTMPLIKVIRWFCTAHLLLRITRWPP